ncbi:tryptophan--tRNA ligase [Candidatus Saccharibacteria bacterium]|nr:tryptophan--tRNA ligase [Candidatus Saccharibacteria bacterium]
MAKEVVLTGLRSNAEFHIGNYLGAILPMVELQKKHAGAYQLNMFIPDLHSFTTPVEHGKLYEQSIENLKVFVAAGLDIEQPDTFIYRQSYIPAHSEMTWILDCFSYFGELSRMTEFKEKSTRQENVTVGLFNYPVLMAADILLYGARWVPVGEDQRQHVEFAREIANRMNSKFGEIFVVPEDNKKQVEFAGRSEPVRIRSLRNPEKKMSKSIDDPSGTIMLSDNPDEAAVKVMSATTDSLANIKYDWQNQPGVTNLLQMIALLTDKQQQEVTAQWQGKSSYSELKTAAAELVKQFLTGLQPKLNQVNNENLMKKLEEDEATMSKVAEERLLSVQKAVGLRPVG